MIRINLLPAEFQKQDGPPPGRLAVIFIDLVFLGAGTMWFLLLLWIRIPTAREAKNEAMKARGLKQRAATTIEDARAKLEVTDEEAAVYACLVREHRVSWSRELERLHLGLGAERAWLESVTASPGDKPSAALRLVATCAVPRDDMGGVRALCAALVRQGWEVEADRGFSVEARDQDAAPMPFEERVRLMLPLVLVPRAGDGSGR